MNQPALLSIYGIPPRESQETPEERNERYRVHRKDALADNWSEVMRFNSVYYEGKDLAEGPSPMHLAYEYINMVMYGFARAQIDGTILLANPYIDCQIDIETTSGCLGAFLSMKKTFEFLRVLLSIGGEETNANMRSIVSSPLLRERFINEALTIVESSGLDGLDIIWEYPSSPGDAENFLLLLEGLRDAFIPSNYILTAKLPSNQHILQNINLHRLGAAIDLLNFSCYDFIAQDGRSMHPAQMNVPPSQMSRPQPSVTQGIRQVLNGGFPPKKVMMGVPLFGRAYQNCVGIGQVYDATDVVYYKNLPLSGTQEIVDRHATAATSGGGTGWLVSYDTPETVRIKGTFVRQLGLAGMFYWMVPWDARTRARSLVLAGHQSMHGND